MFEAEAIRLRQILLDQQDVSPLLNLGSSTLHFRETAKPHIDRELFRPLREAGIAVFHSDIKAGDGVDLAGDILDPATRRALKQLGFKCILISNMLEHVRDRDAVAAACEDIVGPGGLILATAPSSYPFHADPIDTLYRPSPAGLARVFGRSRSLLLEDVPGRTYREDMQARELAVWKEVLRTAVAGLLAFARPKSALGRAHRWLWYSRPYRVSIALVRRESAPPAPCPAP